MRIKVFEYLSPETVDRPMALIDKETVKELHRNLGVIDHAHRLVNQLRMGAELRAFFQRRVQFCIAPQHRIQPLNGGNHDLGDGVNGVRGQVLHVVEFGEFPSVIRRRVLLEFLQRLFPKIAPIYQKQHAMGFGVFDEAVNGGDGGKRLAAARGHLDERPWTVVSKRGLQIQTAVRCAGHSPALWSGGICCRRLRKVEGLPSAWGSACNHSARMSGR